MVKPINTLQINWSYNEKLIFAGLVLLFSSATTLAQPMPPKSCPNAAVIKGVPFTIAIDLIGYFVASADSFGTNNFWVFSMGPITAVSDEDAINKGNQIVQDLSGTPTPKEDDNGAWICEYSLPGKYTAMAMFAGDPSQASISKTKIRRLIKR